MTALAVAASMSTGCGGDSPGGDGDSADTADPYVVVSLWQGCDILDDLNPMQEFLGVEEIGAEGLMDSSPGEGQHPSCQAMFDLATFHYESEFTEYSTTGHANVSVSVTPAPSESESADAYQAIVDQVSEYDNNYETVEGPLEGDWQDSYYDAGHDGTKYHISAYGLHEKWHLSVTVSVSDDPGRTEYNEAKYPDSSEDEMAVFPFTQPELLDWVIGDYMSQTKTDILARIDADACERDPAAC